MFKFNERIEQEAMDTSNLEEGRLYGIKIKNFELLSYDYRPSDTPDEVVYGRFVRKFGGENQTRDEMSEDIDELIQLGKIEIEDHEDEDEDYLLYLTARLFTRYEHIPLYHFELEEGDPFCTQVSVEDCLTGFWAATKDYTFHELLHTNTLKNAAATEEEDEEN
jgi:hypothetical protein